MASNRNWDLVHAGYIQPTTDYPPLSNGAGVIHNEYAVWDTASSNFIYRKDGVATDQAITIFPGLGMKIEPGYCERIVNVVEQKELNFRFRNKGKVGLVIAVTEGCLYQKDKCEIIGPESAINKRLVEGEELWIMTATGFEVGYFEIAFASRPHEENKWPRMAGTEPEIGPGERTKRKPMGE